MKKLSILLIGLVLIAGFAFAETLEERVAAIEKVISTPAFAISGYGQVTFGVNLDGGSTGFDNASEAKLAVTLFANHAPKKAGEGPAYGEIAFKDFRVFGESVNGATGSIQPRAVFDYARIVAGDLMVTIANKPTIDLNLESAIRGANVVAPTEHDGLADFTDLPTFTGAANFESAAITTTGGITIDYALPGVAAIKVGVGSVTLWDVSSDADDAGYDAAANDYALYGQVVVTAIEDATVTLRALAGIAVDEAEYPLAFGAKFEYKLAVGDFTIVPIIGVDIVQAAGADEFGIAIGNGLRFQWAGRQDFDLPHGYGGKGWSGLTVGYGVHLPPGDVDPVINLNAAIVEDETGGFVDGLGFIASMGINDLTAEGDLQLGFSTQLSYKVGDLTPYARLAMVPSTEATTLWAGLKVANVLPLTSLEFAYQSGNFGDEENTLGVFRTILKVTY